MSSFVDSLKFHADTLALRSRRGNVLATNIANAATPHFKARDVNFDAEMRKIAKTNVLDTTHNKHIPVAGLREGELAIASRSIRHWTAIRWKWSSNKPSFPKTPFGIKPRLPLSMAALPVLCQRLGVNDEPVIAS